MNSARSSVPINVEQLFNPAVTSPQEKPTSGFYAGRRHGVSDVSSTRSGLCPKMKASPTVVRNRSQLCAAVSLRIAPSLHFLTAFEQSTRQTSVLFPRLWICAAPKTGAAGFRDGPALVPPARLRPSASCRRPFCCPEKNSSVFRCPWRAYFSRNFCEN